LQSQFSKVGVNLQITKLSSADYFTKLNGHQYGLAGGYFSVSIDPRMTYLMLGRSTSPFNSSGIKSDRLDAVLDKFISEPDEAKAKAIYPDVLTAFGEEAPYMFIANQLQQYWMKPDIHGSVPYPSLEIRVEDMWRGNA
jgi:ABC-type transport system substrate-binding protein